MKSFVAELEGKCVQSKAKASSRAAEQRQSLWTWKQIDDQINQKQREEQHEGGGWHKLAAKETLEPEQPKMQNKTSGKQEAKMQKKSGGERKANCKFDSWRMMKAQRARTKMEEDARGDGVRKCMGPCVNDTQCMK